MNKQPTKWQSRARIDGALRQVWLAYREASDENAEILTDEDLAIWGLVTRHPAIRDRLSAVFRAKNTTNP